MGNVPLVAGDALLASETAGGCEQRDQEKKAANQHSDAEREVVPGRVGVYAGERAAVIAGGAGICIQFFAESVRARVVEVSGGGARRIPVTLRNWLTFGVLGGRWEMDDGRDGGEHKHTERGSEQRRASPF